MAGHRPASCGHAVDPKEQELKMTPCSPWHHPGISALPYSRAYPLVGGNHVGPRRSVQRAIFSRRCHQTPPWSVAGNRLTRDKVGAECTHWRFAHVRRLAHHGGRNVAPPGVSLPSPIAMARYRTTLAVYPAIRVRATISVRGRTRTGRIWFV